MKKEEWNKLMETKLVDTDLDDDKVKHIFKLCKYMSTPIFGFLAFWSLYIDYRYFKSYNYVHNVLINNGKGDKR